MLLRVSAEAGADLDSIRIYGFEHYGERAADAYLAELVRSFDRIAQWPFAARLRTDIEPILAMARVQAGGAIDPVAAYRASGYRKKVAGERPAVASGGGGIV